MKLKLPWQRRKPPVRREEKLRPEKTGLGMARKPFRSVPRSGPPVTPVAPPKPVHKAAGLPPKPPHVPTAAKPTKPGIRERKWALVMGFILGSLFVSVVYSMVTSFGVFTTGFDLGLLAVLAVVGGLSGCVTAFKSYDRMVVREVEFIHLNDPEVGRKYEELKQKHHQTLINMKKIDEDRKLLELELDRVYKEVDRLKELVQDKHASLKEMKIKTEVMKDRAEEEKTRIISEQIGEIEKLRREVIILKDKLSEKEKEVERLKSRGDEVLAQTRLGEELEKTKKLLLEKEDEIKSLQSKLSEAKRELEIYKEKITELEKERGLGDKIIKLEKEEYLREREELLRSLGKRRQELEQKNREIEKLREELQRLKREARSAST